MSYRAPRPNHAPTTPRGAVSASHQPRPRAPLFRGRGWVGRGSALLDGSTAPPILETAMDAEETRETAAAVAALNPFAPRKSKWSTAGWVSLDLAVISLCVLALGFNQLIVLLIVTSMSLGIEFIKGVSALAGAWFNWKMRHAAQEDVR